MNILFGIFVMRFFAVLLVMTGLGLSLFFLSSFSESDATLISIIKEPTANEVRLMEEEGYYAEPYSLMPFGSKHFFFKSDPMPSIGEISNSRCMFSATFLPIYGKPVQMSMKFPNDLVWPGMYDNSTFFSVTDQFASHVDESGNTVINDQRSVEYEKLTPTRDSEFTTIDLELKGEVSHVVINMTTYPVNLKPGEINEICPPVLPPMRSDYYDSILPKDTQKIIAEMRGYPPDTYICPNNKIGAIKAADNRDVCVKPDSKTKLIERGWAKDFLKIKESLSSFADKVIPTVVEFKTILHESSDIDFIFSKFGKPHDDVGSGIHIYVYELNDSSEIWIGYADEVLYVKHVDSKGNLIEELFARPSEPQPNAFGDGVTEIINPEHEPLKYTKTIQVIDDVYLSKNVEQWQDVSDYYMKSQHDKLGDDFYKELGKLLIKNEFQYQLNSLGIENANEDFEIFSGMMLLSLPPHIQYTAVVLGKDNNYYRLEGTAHANQVSFYSTQQLQLPDTEILPASDSIVDENARITILPEDGNKAREDPSTLIIHTDHNDTVEFFNNTPQTIRIQDSGSGVIGEENTLSWMGPTILPYQSATMTFDEPGLVEWDARNFPTIEEPWWWSTHAGGNIVVLSENVDDLPVEEKLRMAQKIIHTQDLPIMGSGSGNAEKALKVHLDPAVVSIISDAKQYYLERIQQIIPFDVKVIME